MLACQLIFKYSPLGIDDIPVHVSTNHISNIGIAIVVSFPPMQQSNIAERQNIPLIDFEQHGFLFYHINKLPERFIPTSCSIHINIEMGITLWNTEIYSCAVTIRIQAGTEQNKTKFRSQN